MTEVNTNAATPAATTTDTTTATATVTTTPAVATPAETATIPAATDTAPAAPATVDDTAPAMRSFVNKVGSFKKILADLKIANETAAKEAKEAQDAAEVVVKLTTLKQDLATSISEFNVTIDPIFEDFARAKIEFADLNKQVPAAAAGTTSAELVAPVVVEATA